MPSTCRPFRRTAFLASLLMLASGCAFVAPRFPQNIQADFAREDMRKLTTRSLELYYPAPLRPTALRVAARLEGCVERLRGLTWSQTPRARALIYLTGSDFNNAYVVPDYASTPQQMVLPQHMTLELFNLFGLGETDIGDVACHEAVHYVQMQQMDGLWEVLNKITGGLYQANIFTESWFLEGLATFYEGRLGKETGRPYSPIWRGWYESAVQEQRGRLNPGYLSPEHRALDPFGGNYVTGMHFVEYLADTYGEKKLWQLVDDQGDSIVPPLAVTLRFKKVYGRDIGALFEEYTRVLRRNLVARERPATQQVFIPDVGYFTRLASRAEDGVTAVYGVGREETARLVVYERDGRVRFKRSLVELLPGRDWVQASPTLMSGLSFSRDGAWLYMVGADVDSEGGNLARLWRVDARTGEVVRLWEGLRGMGGGVTPDGTGYVFVGVQADAANLVRLDLESGRQEPLTRFDAHVALGPPSVAPDGQRIVFPMAGADGWDLVLREADGSLRWLTKDGRFNYSPKWLDAERIVFLREHERRLQAHVMTVATGELVRITEAPHLVMDVGPGGQDEVVFLNRQGTHFTVDRAPIAAIAPSPTGEARATGPAPSAPSPTEQGPSVSATGAAPPPGAEQATSATASTAPPLPGEEHATGPTSPLPPGEGQGEGSTSPSSPTVAQGPTPPPEDTDPLTPPPLPGEATQPPASEQPAPPAPERFSEFPGQPPTPDSPQATTAPPVSGDTGLEAPVQPPPVAEGVELLSDEPYSLLEDFFIPEFRLPFIYTVPDDDAGRDETQFVGGLALAGQDRLGFHAYSLVLNFDSTQDEPSVSLAYGNAQLAPWYIQASASRIREDRRTDLQATAFASRTFWTTPVTFGLLALRREFDATTTRPKLVTRLIGPEVAVSYFAGEGTSYGGTQRGLGLGLSGGLYPKAFFRESTVGDVRLSADGYLGGLPFTGKDNFQVSAVARYLPGAPSGLLEVGGILPGQVFYTNRDTTDEGPLPLQLQPGVAFSEYLRGYEDRTFRARNVLIANARYRYRFIIDYGWASTLYLLPSLFVSQFELEGFGSLARTDNRNNHGAVGGSATLRFTLAQTVPFALFYQYAHRFDEGLGDLHLVGISY